MPVLVLAVCTVQPVLARLCLVQAAWIPGVSLLVDFPFAAYPDNFGHWAEVLLPIYNFVRQQPWPAHAAGAHNHIDTLVLTNLRKDVLSVRPILPLFVAKKWHAACRLYCETCMRGHGYAAEGQGWQ